MPKFIQIRLDQINVEDSFQPRIETDEDRANDYAEKIQAGTTFPPVTVYHDGRTYWMSDGFTRHRAYEIAGRKTIEAEVHDGSQRDAMKAALSANEEHGYRRTNADKRRVVTAALQDDEWGKPRHGLKSEIAKLCAVSHSFVANVIDDIRDTANETESIHDHGCVPDLVTGGGTVVEAKPDPRASASTPRGGKKKKVRWERKKCPYCKGSGFIKVQVEE